MAVRAEVARCAVQAAAVTVDQPDVGDAAVAAAGAKLLADEAAVANGRSCIQVHGGHGVHLGGPRPPGLQAGPGAGHPVREPTTSWPRPLADSLADPARTAGPMCARLRRPWTTIPHRGPYAEHR